MIAKYLCASAFAFVLRLSNPVEMQRGALIVTIQPHTVVATHRHSSFNTALVVAPLTHGTPLLAPCAEQFIASLTTAKVSYDALHDIIG